MYHRLLGLILLTPLFAHGEDLVSLVAAEVPGRVRETMQSPTATTLNSVLYRFPEIRLAPGDVLLADVPAGLRTRAVSQVGLAHRQDEAPTDRDPRPGLSALWVRDGASASWRYWDGPASGRFGAKFAEQRPSPEYDALYEWPLRGHRGLDGTRGAGPVLPRALRLQNTGVDDVLVSTLYLETVPAPVDEHAVLVFSPGSDFGDAQTFQGRRYGGGQRFQGTFPGAVALDSRWEGRPVTRQGATLDGHKLILDLPPGKKLMSVDVMCGDTFPDRVRNRDRGWGSLGNAKLTVLHRNAGGAETVLREGVNVGPEGVESAFPVAPLRLAAGDQLIVKNQRGRSSLYVMAIRLGYDQ